MIEIKECLVVDGRFYTTGDIVEVVTDGGTFVGEILRERYVGRIKGVTKHADIPNIMLDVSDIYCAETVHVPLANIKDVLIHAPSLMQSELQSDSTEKKHGKSLFRFLHKD